MSEDGVDGGSGGTDRGGVDRGGVDPSTPTDPIAEPDPAPRIGDSRRDSTGAAADARAEAQLRSDLVPTPLRVTSEISARLLVIAAGLGLLVYLVILLRVVVIPVAIAILLAAALAAPVRWLVARRVPRGVATGLVLVGGLALLGGLLSFVVNTFISGLPALQEQLAAGLLTIEELLTGPPFNLPDNWLADLPDQIIMTISENSDALTSGALSTAATLGEVVAGIALALFALLFFLYDGPRIWRFLIRLAPSSRRDRVDVAGLRAFASLVGYVRATVLVAFVDAIGIGLGLFFVGAPLAVPLSALVFLGAFIPIVGAVLTGGIAVLVVLVAQGPIPALIILGVVLAVQQLEGNVLQPLLMGKAVSLHPLAVVLAVSAGVVMSGITGALLAVPLLAVVNTAVRSFTAEHQPAPGSVDPVDPRHAQLTAGSPGPRAPSRFTRLLRRLARRSGADTGAQA